MTPREPEPFHAYDEGPRAVCSHSSGIERVEVTQPQGSKYEWWRCMVCHCEFRPTGQVRPGEGPDNFAVALDHVRQMPPVPR